jgi:hypothetical protein
MINSHHHDNALDSDNEESRARRALLKATDERRLGGAAVSKSNWAVHIYVSICSDENLVMLYTTLAIKTILLSFSWCLLKLR